MRHLCTDSGVVVPAELEALLKQIRNGLPPGLNQQGLAHKEWTKAFLAEIASNADLHRTWDRFAIWMMSDCRRLCDSDEAKRAIDFAILLYKQSNLIRPCMWRYAESRLTAEKFSRTRRYSGFTLPIDVALSCVQLKLRPSKPYLAAVASNLAAQSFVSALRFCNRSNYRMRAYQRQANELLRLVNATQAAGEDKDERDEHAGGICNRTSSCKCWM